MTRLAEIALVGALLVCGCAGRQEVKSSDRAYAEPATATVSTTEPRNVACSKSDAEIERKYRTVPSQELEAQIVSRVQPRLAPDSRAFGNYLISVDVDGHVTEVRMFELVPGGLVVANALCQWKFKPLAQPTRSVLMMAFQNSTRFR